MAKINYGPPAINPTERASIMSRDPLGPGIQIGMSQRSAELAVSVLCAANHQR
jgi:hypothetical protein